MKKTLNLIFLIFALIFLFSCNKNITIHQYELVINRYDDENIEIKFPYYSNDNYSYYDYKVPYFGASYLRQLEINECVNKVNVKNIESFINKRTNEKTVIIYSFKPTEAIFYINEDGSIISVIENSDVYISNKGIIDYYELLAPSQNLTIDDLTIKYSVIYSGETGTTLVNKTDGTYLSFYEQNKVVFKNNPSTSQDYMRFINAIIQGCEKGNLEEKITYQLNIRRSYPIDRSLKYVTDLYREYLYVQKFNSSLNKDMKICQLKTNIFGYEERLNPIFNLYSTSQLEHNRHISTFNYIAYCFNNDNWIIYYRDYTHHQPVVYVVLGDFISLNDFNTITNQNDEDIEKEVQRLYDYLVKYYEKYN